MKTFLVALVALASLAGSLSGASLPSVTQGTIERLEAFPSQYVQPRNIDVWLPPGFDASRRYPVLYMHDGQMLYDASTTWNKLSWELANTLTRLIAEQKVPPVIVVGVWSTGPTRHAEYFPAKALESLTEPTRSLFLEKALGGRSQSDAYLRFLVTELKPAIDAKYPTLTDAAHTSIMGSSMGGIISLYAFCEYPEVFGKAGCLSTHWPGGFEANASIPLSYLNYLQQHLPSPAGRRLYMDRGTKGIDRLYAVPQDFFDLIAREKGYAKGSFESRAFEEADHTEIDWARRVEIPLVFLLGG